MPSSAVLHPGLRFRYRAADTARRRSAGSEPVPSRVLVAIVNAGGRIDANRVDAFAHELDRALTAGAGRLLVDLSQAEEVTTAAMNALLAARQELIGGEDRIAVVLPDRLRRRFRLLQLDGRFLLASDRLGAAELLGLVPGGDIGERRPTRHAHAA